MWMCGRCFTGRLAPAPGLRHTARLRHGETPPVPHSGASPSGKASVFGTDIRRFESSRPSHPFSLVLPKPAGKRRLQTPENHRKFLWRRSGQYHPLSWAAQMASLSALCGVPASRCQLFIPASCGAPILVSQQAQPAARSRRDAPASAALAEGDRCDDGPL